LGATALWAWESDPVTEERVANDDDDDVISGRVAISNEKGRDRGRALFIDKSAEPVVQSALWQADGLSAAYILQRVLAIE
jgi:hypothetical protein